MGDLLQNPVFNALNTGDAALGYGTGDVKYFDTTVSPFIGIRSGYERGFDELHVLLPEERRILRATPAHILIPEKWRLIEKVEGIQMCLAATVASYPQACSRFHLQGQL